jgi:hypothetical protein
MADIKDNGSAKGDLAPALPEKVMQVERHDYPDLTRSIPTSSTISCAARTRSGMNATSA